MTDLWVVSTRGPSGTACVTMLAQDVPLWCGPDGTMLIARGYVSIGGGVHRSYTPVAPTAEPAT